jgi:hypothetical protein
MAVIDIDQPNAQLRRIFLVVRDQDGQLVEDASAYSAGQLRKSVNGAAWTNALGSLVPVGGGEHYYEATLGEVAASQRGFLWVRLDTRVDGVGNFGEQWSSIGEPFGIGETDSLLLRAPFTIYDFDNFLVAGVAAHISTETKTSKNGAGLGAAAGALVEVGLGLYYYQAVPADSEDVGHLAIVVTSDISATAIAFAITKDDNAPPQASVDSPPEGSGETDFATATYTPRVLRVLDSGSPISLLFVTASCGGADAFELVYRGDPLGSFTANYNAESSVDIDGSDYVLTIHREGGWPPGALRITVDGCDAAGNAIEVI